MKMSRLQYPPGIQPPAQVQLPPSQLLAVRIQIATETYSKLVASEYQRVVAEAVLEATRYGNDDQQVKIEPESILSKVNVGLPATIAVRSADFLMMALGLVPPPSTPG